jgi:hypothetical protein
MSTANGTDEIVVPQLDNLVKLDPYLKPHEGEIKRR